MKLVLLCTIMIYLAALLTSTTSQLVRLPVKKAHPSVQSKNDFLNLDSRSGSIDIKNYANSQYIATISVGSKNQEFNVVLDTGSANLWIPDPTLSGSVDDTFDCGSSSTCSSNQLDTQILEYGKGEVIGYTATDQINLGGMVIPQCQFIIAQQINSIPTVYLDGLIGLSLGQYLPGFPTILDLLKNNGLISIRTFSIYLGDDSGSSGSKTGEIIFGGYDPKYALTEFQFVNIRSVDETLFWSSDVSAIGYGAGANISTGFPVIFDSGTSLLALPQNIIDGLITKASTVGVSISYNIFNGLYTCDCSGSKKLDDLIFYFNNASFNVPAASYTYSQYDGCYLGIQPIRGSASVDNPAILGDVFLKNYYALYTADNSTVGLAKAVPVKHFPVWGIILIILAVIGLIFAGFYCYKKRKQARAENGATNNYRAFQGNGRPIGGN